MIVVYQRSDTDLDTDIDFMLNKSFMLNTPDYIYVCYIHILFMLICMFRIFVCVCVALLPWVSCSLSPQALVHQALLSMEFSRHEYGVISHSLLQVIFPTQGSNPGLTIAGRFFLSEPPGNIYLYTYVAFLVAQQ